MLAEALTVSHSTLHKFINLQSELDEESKKALADPLFEPFDWAEFEAQMGSIPYLSEEKRNKAWQMEKFRLDARLSRVRAEIQKMEKDFRLASAMYYQAKRFPYLLVPSQEKPASLAEAYWKWKVQEAQNSIEEMDGLRYEQLQLELKILAFKKQEIQKLLDPEQPV